MSFQLHNSRNLTVDQTLDNILNGCLAPDAPTSSSSDRNSLNSPLRPPTRHGRDSSGSNEENKDPVNSEASVSNSNDPLSFLTSSTASRRHSEDDFIKKLNDIRRRSLITTMDAPPQSTSSSVSSVSLFSDPIKPEPRQRLEIHVEEADETPAPPSEVITFHNESEKPEEPRLTFRKDDGNGKNEEKPGKSVPKVPKSALKNGNPNPEPKPKSSSGPVKKKEETSLMMQKSMFNSANSKPSDAHHKEWLAKKEKEIRERKLKEREAEEKKKENEKERRENSARLYQRWVKDHDEKMKKFKSIRNMKEKQKLERQQSEKDEKKKEAEKNYEVWKRERSKSLSDIRKKLSEEEEKKRKIKEEELARKQKEAHAAFLAWKRKKEEFLSEDARKQRKKARERFEEEERNSKDYRFMCANEAFETWMEMKDKEREMLADLVLIEAPPIPWIPPSNLVPRQFVRSARGTRPKQRSQSAKPNASRGRSRPSTTTSLRPFR